MTKLAASALANLCQPERSSTTRMLKSSHQRRPVGLDVSGRGFESPRIRPSLLQEPLGTKVRCHVCERRCLLVSGGRGWCRIRENRSGQLVTEIYGAVSSISANPIEKKPLFHFHPGSVALTAGSWSCNFGCPWCQNWSISKTTSDARDLVLSPEKFVDMTGSYGCQGTSISFNEPTLSLEWSVDVFRLARDRGFYNTFVTNGYMTPEALSLLIEAGLDAMNVDVKGDHDTVRRFCKGVDLEKVWRTCALARAGGVHIEITTLVIPEVNAGEEILRQIAGRIVSELGQEVPWHVSAYFPAYRFRAPPTPAKALEVAYEIGREVGLAYVYVGNHPGHPHGDTYCPDCGALLIRRSGFDVLQNEVREGRCPHCARPVAGVWG